LRYRLVVLTHGDSAPLARTLSSFGEMVSPAPNDVIVGIDAEDTAAAERIVHDALLGWPREKAVGAITISLGGHGCCVAVGALWRFARRPGHDYVFWLEHDFLFERPVDLRELAAVLDAQPHVAEMTLVRQAVGTEPDPGGFIATGPGWYHPRETRIEGQGWPGDVPIGAVERTAPWLEHRRNFSLNPSLIRRDFIERNDWPAGAGCEHVFSAQVVEADPEATFGLWGDGEPWVSHFGEHDGHGY
jgi:hypothetical protein